MKTLASAKQLATDLWLVGGESAPLTAAQCEAVDAAGFGELLTVEEGHLFCHDCRSTIEDGFESGFLSYCRDCSTSMEERMTQFFADQGLADLQHAAEQQWCRDAIRFPDGE